jgi:hypothetical protein
MSPMFRTHLQFIYNANYNSFTTAENPFTIHLQHFKIQLQFNYNASKPIYNSFTTLQNPITIHLQQFKIQLQFNYNGPNPFTIHLQQFKIQLQFHYNASKPNYNSITTV